MSDINDTRIPVTIITGFLGSGKTTLLNNWVKTPEFKDTLVLINEFGNVGLDHELVESVDDPVVLLESGCICCTLQGELINSLLLNLQKSLKGIIPRFKRVFIETTGLADPAGVISTLNGDQLLLETYRYDGTITILDAQFIRKQLKEQYEAVKQIALADLILISKTDLIDAEEIDAIYNVAHQINPSVKIFPIIKGNITPKIIEDVGPYKASLNTNPNKIMNWLATGEKLAPSIRKVTMSNSIGLAKPKIIAHSDIDSFSSTYKDPIDPLALLAAINLVQEQYGDSILRIKGILNLKDQELPVVIHGVQGNLYPLSELKQWPTEDHSSKLVFIVRKAVLEQIKHIFDHAINNPDESTLSYYQDVINQALNQDDATETIELNKSNNKKD